MPAGAKVIDGTGKYVTPGIIDAHSHIATSSVNEATSPVTAEVQIEDVLDPYDIGIYRALAGGVTVSHILHGSANAIGGQSETIKHRWGERDPEAIKMDGAPRTIKFALGENPTRVHGRGYGVVPATRMGVEQVIRAAFAEAGQRDLHQRLLDAALDTASRLPADGTYLNTVASAVMDVHGDIYTGVNGISPVSGRKSVCCRNGSTSSAGSGRLKTASVRIADANLRVGRAGRPVDQGCRGTSRHGSRRGCRSSLGRRSAERRCRRPCLPAPVVPNPGSPPAGRGAPAGSRSSGRADGVRSGA